MQNMHRKCIKPELCMNGCMNKGTGRKYPISENKENIRTNHINTICNMYKY